MSTTEKKPTTTKKTAAKKPAVKSDPKIAKLEADNRQLFEKLDRLEGLLARFAEASVAPEKAEDGEGPDEITRLKEANRELAEKTSQIEAALRKVSKEAFVERAASRKNDDVVIVHLVERDPSLRTHIDLSNYSIDLVRFGEERTLTVQQFEELVGKYRSWFDIGILAVADESSYYAERNKLKTVRDYPIETDFVQKLGTLSLPDLENIYNRLGEGHKDFIITYFKQKIIQKDPNFKNINKMELLNRLSGGCLKHEISKEFPTR